MTAQTASIHELQQAKSAGLPATAPLATANRDVAVVPGFNSASGWELAQRIAKAWMAADLVPQAYRGNLPNTIVALEMANRMGASPLMVMQNLYIVHGNPGWSSKFLIACFNQCGRFTALRYKFRRDATGKAIACRAWAIEKATGETLEGAEITLDMAKDEGWSTKSGSKWKTMGEQMLMYRSASFMIRTYAPEISMGLQTVDEITDGIYDAPEGSVRTINDMQPAALAPADPPPASSPVIDNADRPDTGTEEHSAQQPQREERQEHPADDRGPAPSYAQLATKLNKAKTRAAAELILDEGRALPTDQQADLQRVFDDRFPL